MYNRRDLTNQALPSLHQDGQQTGEARWMVVIFNNDITPLEAVIEILMLATGCDAEEATIEAWEAHHLGQSAVHFDSQSRCEQIARTITGIGVQTEVKPEWID